MKLVVVLVLALAACAHSGVPGSSGGGGSLFISETESEAEEEGPQTITDGTFVEIVALGEFDEHRDRSAELVGQVCRVTWGGLERSDGYYTGAVKCMDGAGYYFHEVRVVVTEGSAFTEAEEARRAAAAEARQAAVEERRREEAAAEPAPSPTRYGAKIAAGSRLTITEVAANDAYYGDRAAIEGLSCVVSTDLKESTPGYYGGEVRCSDGADYYFYDVAVSVTSSPPSAGRYGPVIAAGTAFTIVEVHADDAYYQARTAVEGLSCVASEDLEEKKHAGFYAGEVRCDDGKDYYFYKVSVNLSP